VQKQLLDMLHRIRKVDSAASKMTEFSLAVELIRENLAGIQGGKGNYLTDGITISALQPLRPIPFQIVYILGLNETVFPGYEDRSTIDLRVIQDRKSGDISKPESDYYLFLESVFSARKKLYLFFDGEDLEKDETKLPSPVIEDLIRFTELKTGVRLAIKKIPLNPSNTGDTGGEDDLDFYHDMDLYDAYSKERIQPGEQVKDSPQEKTQVQLRVKNLSDFLKNPLREALRLNQGLLQGIESFSEDHDPPFQQKSPYNWQIIRKISETILERLLHDENHLLTGGEINEIFHPFVLKGAVPAGEFGEAQVNYFTGLSAGWMSPEIREGFEALRSLRRIRNPGIGRVNRKGEEHLPPLRLLTENLDAEISGHAENLWLSANDLYLFQFVNTQSVNGPVPYYLLEPFIFAACYLLSQKLSPIESIHVWLGLKNGSLNKYRWKISLPVLQEWLESLADHLICHRDIEYIPLQMVNDFWKIKNSFDREYWNPEILQEWIDDEEEESLTGLTALLEKKVTSRCFESAAARFGCLFERLVTDA
jgi:hypothetical protein